MLQKPVTRGERTIRHLPLFFSPLTEWRTLPAVANKPLRDLFEKKEQKINQPRYRVALFGGCANDFLYPELGLDLIEVMNALNVEVFILRSKIAVVSRPYIPEIRKPHWNWPGRMLKRCWRKTQTMS